MHHCTVRITTMKFSIVAICVAAVILTLVFDADAWWWRRRRFRCSRPTSGSKPYYFGTTSLWCMMRNAKKGKRASAPSRSTLRPSHRFIYYQGYYFEFGIGPRDLAVYATTNAGSPRCSPRREGSPAGYSKLSVECIKRCTRSYERRFGKWRLFTHNCHHFTNNLSKVLCNSRRCPGWCQ